MDGFVGPITVAPRGPRIAWGVSTTEAFQSGSFGFKLIGATVADGSSRVEVLVPEGELETNGGGTEAANGTVESRRETTPRERLIIFKAVP